MNTSEEAVVPTRQQNEREFLKYLKRILDSIGRGFYLGAVRQGLFNVLEEDSSAKVLDCGCNNGKLTEAVGKEIGTRELCGIELVDRWIPHAQERGIQVTKADLNQRFPFEDNTFDVVFASQIIEHLYNTDLFVKEIWRVLKPGGYTVISTPNLASLHCVIMLLLGFQPTFVSDVVRVGNPLYGRQNNVARFPAQSHLRTFTWGSLKELFEYYGFKVEKIFGLGYYPFPKWLARFLARIDGKHSVNLVMKARKPASTKLLTLEMEQCSTKIGISMFCNDILEDIGDTVRAKRVFDILSKYHDVTLITSTKKKAPDNIINITPGRSKLWNLKLVPVLMRKRFDCIYCSNDWRGFLTYWLFSKVRRCKVIFEAHSIVSEDAREVEGPRSLKFKLARFLEKFVVKRADSVIALSENTLTFYKNYNAKIDLIPVFTDEDAFKLNGEKLKEPGGGNGSRQIGVIGPFDTAANEYFLEFLYNNVDRFDDRIRLVVIGRCHKQIKSERIIYTGYLESLQDYVNQLCGVDAVILPARIATTGPLNKILEAMSCSLPVFTTPKGITGLYYVEPDKEIFVFDENKLVNRINELIFDDDLMETVGRNARKAVEKHYSRKVNAQKLDAVLKKIVPGRTLRT